MNSVQPVTPVASSPEGKAPPAAPQFDLFSWLVSPVAPPDFLANYYERQVLVVTRNDPGYYREWLSLEDIDRVVGTHGVRVPDVRLVKLDKDIPVAEYSGATGVIDPRRFAKLHGEGATAVFSQLHTHLPALAELCTALSHLFSSRMQTNIYLTPPDAQGFMPHWDTHDTFIFQIAGTKHWTIFDTKIPLPLPGQGFEAKNPDHVAGEPTRQFTMRAGDMVYIPRGVMHAARCTEEMSLHITTGLLGFTWGDLFTQVVNEAANNELALRHNLPIGFARGAVDAAHMEAMAKERLALLAPYIEAGGPIANLVSELLLQNQPSLTNLIRETLHAHEVTADTVVQSRPGALWRAEEEGDQVVISWGRVSVKLPEFVTNAVLFMQRTPRFKVADIPDCLDEPGKVTLVRRLIREGILQTAPSGGHGAASAASAALWRRGEA